MPIERVTEIIERAEAELQRGGGLVLTPTPARALISEIRALRAAQTIAVTNENRLHAEIGELRKWQLQAAALIEDSDPKPWKKDNWQQRKTDLLWEYRNDD